MSTEMGVGRGCDHTSDFSLRDPLPKPLGNNRRTESYKVYGVSIGRGFANFKLTGQDIVIPSPTAQLRQARLVLHNTPSVHDWQLVRLIAQLHPGHLKARLQ